MPSKNIPRYFFVRSVEIDWFRFTTIISIYVPFILLFALSFFSAACVFFVILFCFFFGEFDERNYFVLYAKSHH